MKIKAKREATDHDRICKGCEALIVGFETDGYCEDCLCEDCGSTLEKENERGVHRCEECEMWGFELFEDLEI
jgi:hypothetical protein